MTIQLSIIGPARALRRFDARAAWPRAMRHPVLWRCSPDRHEWEFGSDRPCVGWLTKVSRFHPELVFLLQYDDERRRIRGLIRAGSGMTEHLHLIY